MRYSTPLNSRNGRWKANNTPARVRPHASIAGAFRILIPPPYSREYHGGALRADGPYNEKYGGTVNGFDTTGASPLAAAAQAAYAKAPLAQLPAGQFNVLGGLTFPGAGGTAIYKNNSHLVSPRFGFAWTP